MNKTAKPVAARLAAEPYGRFELRRVYKRYHITGLAVAAALHLVIVGSYYFVKYVTAEEDIPMVSVRILKYSDLGPPPSIAPAPPPPSVGVATAAKPSVGIPVPVPDAEVSPDQTLATQAELQTMTSPALEDLGLGTGGVEITQDIMIDDLEPGMDDFIPVEKAPQIVRKAIPDYPEMAMRAGLEGTVWVKVLVDRDGKPMRAVVIKSTTEIFNDPAVNAAMKFMFTPAVMNHGPVRVWVSIPFRFQLKDAAPS
jgi:protein TonB